jgi:hypothetical protein
MRMCNHQSSYTFFWSVQPLVRVQHFLDIPFVDNIESICLQDPPSPLFLSIIFEPVFAFVQLFPTILCDYLKAFLYSLRLARSVSAFNLRVHISMKRVHFWDQIVSTPKLISPLRSLKTFWRIITRSFVLLGSISSGSSTSFSFMWATSVCMCLSLRFGASRRVIGVFRIASIAIWASERSVLSPRSVGIIGLW